jgi:hypothetical protein
VADGYECSHTSVQLRKPRTDPFGVLDEFLGAVHDTLFLTTAC